MCVALNIPGFTRFLYENPFSARKMHLSSLCSRQHADAITVVIGLIDFWLTVGTQNAGLQEINSI